jgi:hypothetical protein
VVVDIVAGLVAVADIVANTIAHWRFVVCFAPAFALALFLYFSIPDRLGSITVAALVVTLAGAAGTIWEVTSRSSRRNRKGD